MSGLALYCERALTWHGHAFTTKEVGLLLSYVGVISLLIQLLLMGFLVRKLGEVKIMLLGFSSTALALIVMGFSPLLSVFLVGISINTFGNAILRPSISGMLSQNASPAHQGLVFGLNQTLMSIAQIICPLISGFLIEKEWTLIWCLSISAISLLGFFVGKLASTKINYQHA
jgi:MFS family permease